MTDQLTDEQVIRKAVELADGWREHRGTFICDELPMSWLFDRLDDAAFNEDGYEAALDALAAQLVRQVDALYDTDLFFVDADRWMVRIEKHSIGTMGRSGGPDRTMNTLRAIVESGVLDK